MVYSCQLRWLLPTGCVVCSQSPIALCCSEPLVFSVLSHSWEIGVASHLHPMHEAATSTLQHIQAVKVMQGCSSWFRWRWKLLLSSASYLYLQKEDATHPDQSYFDEFERVDELAIKCGITRALWFIFNLRTSWGDITQRSLYHLDGAELVGWLQRYPHSQTHSVCAAVNRTRWSILHSVDKDSSFIVTQQANWE